VRFSRYPFGAERASIIESQAGQELVARAGHFRDGGCKAGISEVSFSAQMPTGTATHIWLDERGVAWIDQTNGKVIEVVLDKLAHGSSPEEMHFQYPHLSLSQIYAALAYYHDHQPEMDAQIERGAREYQRLKSQAGETPLQKRLKELGKLG